MFICFECSAQKIFIIKDSTNAEPIVGAAIKIINTDKGANTDVDGKAILNSNQAAFDVNISYIGYEEKNIHLDESTNYPLIILLSPSHEELDQVIVYSTRTNNRIEDAPLKVEVLGLEEVNEENSIKPGNVTSLLGDISSIQIQQLSAINNNSVVRMQGLDGKYTLLLRDGMPAYGSLSGGLSLLQIPPLDLHQIEIIKGPASTLNGGGAIAGLINFVSKRPPVDKPESSFTLNRSTLGETNLNFYTAASKGDWGYTLITSYTHQGARDVNKDGFSDLPLLNDFIFHPRLFYNHDKDHLVFGYSYTDDVRNGGDLIAIQNRNDAAHPFFTDIKTKHHGFDIDYKHNFDPDHLFSFKSSLNDFNRRDLDRTTSFHGVQDNVYSEAYYSIHHHQHQWILGANYVRDDFNKKSRDSLAIHSFHDNTVGFFSQYSFSVPDKINLDLGFRIDHHNQYGWFALPSVAMLIHSGKSLSFRINGGTGYKSPELLELVENEYYQNKASSSLSSGIRAENSIGGTLEWNYKKVYENDLSLFINQTFFITQIRHSVRPIVLSSDRIFYDNSLAFVSTKGIDNYITIHKQPYEFYLGYTYTRPIYDKNASIPFITYTPLHRAAMTLVDEVDEHWRLGIESSYNGYQYLDNGNKSKGYYFAAASVQYKTGHVTFVLNGENLFDFRQSKSEAIVTGGFINPQFKKLWGPIDGRVINLSMMVKW